MSDSSLSQLEYEIEEMIHSLSTCNADDYFEYIDEIEKKIHERNSRCRLLKTGR